MILPIWDFFSSSALLSLGLGCLSLILIRLCLNPRNKKKYKLPPGPPSYPLVGNLLTLVNAKGLLSTLLNLKKEYGNIFKLSIGHSTIIFVTDMPTIREGLVKKGDLTKGRANWIYWVYKIFRKKGVLFSMGQSWKNMRRFGLTCLRDLGMGKQGMEQKILEEIFEIKSIFENSDEKPFKLYSLVANAATNLIHNIIFGERLQYDDPEFKSIFSILDYFFKNGSNSLIENFLPWIEYVPLNTTAKQLIRNDKKLQKYIGRKIQEHRETFDEKNIHSLIDMYLLMTQKDSKDNYTEEEIYRTVVDIFVAGSETSATALLWIFLYVTKYQHIQIKCREEISKVTEMNRMVNMGDRQAMPYVCATIHEAQRIATAVPSTIPHVAEQDITLGPYDIPKGTIIEFVISAAHWDPTYWKNPMEFDPNRWLDEEGKLKQNDAFLPFSLGPRMCMGEPLARMELFLFFTNLIQEFEFLVPENHPMSLEGIQTGVTFQPHNSMVCVRALN